jgi:hypothetical protein
VRGALERYRLSPEVQERLEELRDLSEKAENGERGARQELREKLHESSADIVVRASDIGRKAQRLLIETASGGDPLTEDALSGRLDMMQAEIAGENPTPVEVLLTERVVACGLLVELFEWLMATQLWKGNPPENRVTLAALKYYLRWQESANRFFVASVRGARQGKEAAEHNAGDLVQHADQRESPARIAHEGR